ncbi:MAG: Gfo/Idh/MocA family oxidoreductase [bacterium]
MVIRLGVIGLGHWGPNYVRNFGYLSDRAKIVAVSDLNPRSFAKLASPTPGAVFYRDWQEMLAKEDLDAVIISTPAKTHFKIARICLLKNKHVLVEKPLALKVKEAKGLLTLAKSRRKILMVGHTFLYNLSVRKVKEYIDKGRIGRIYYMQAVRTHLGLIRDDVDAAWDLATHDVAIFNYLIGAEPQSVVACGGEYLKAGKKDAAFITLFYPAGILGNIQVSWIDSNKVRQIVVVGSKSRVVFNDLDSLEPVRVYKKGVSVERPVKDFGEFKLLLRDGDIISPKIEPREPLSLVCEHFIDCIKSRRRPITDGASGLAVVRVMCAIEKSMKNRGRLIKI